VRRLVLAGSLLARLAAPPDTTTSIPFVYEDARVFVPVHVDSGPPRWFILDTGVSGVMLDGGLARELRLSVADAGRTSGVGTGSLALGRASDVTLRVGTVPLGPTDARVLSLDSVLAPYGGRAAPGVIGSPLFREHVVELDFDRSVMILHDPKAFHYQGHGIVIPIRFFNEIPVTDGRLAPPGSATPMPLRLAVDLGAKATLLFSEPFILAHHLMQQFPRHTESPLGAGIGGETRYAFARARSLVLIDSRGGESGASLDNPVVGLSVRGTFRAEWCDGLLGAEFLRGYRVIFDYAHGQLILEARHPALQAAEYDMSGMFVVSDEWDRHRFVVHEVLPNGPAATAGVAAGDRIVSVDGQPVFELTLGDLRNVLRSRPGRSVAITIERGGVRLGLLVTLVRQV
jgi:hypothetical protein